MKKKRLKLIAGSILAGIGVYTLIDALFLEQYFFEVKEYSIGNIGKSNRKIRMLLLTDLHLRHINKQHHKLAAKINSIDPDIILIAGDAIDEHANAGPLYSFLELINISIPKVAIMGNHDHKSTASKEEISYIYQQHNCDLLINESKSYELNGVRLMVTGLDDFIESTSDLKAAVEGVGKEEYHIMLIHSPFQQDMIKREMEEINALRPENDTLNISYLFAGHNHGGQVAFAGIAPYLPEGAGGGIYTKGWYNDKKPYLYVSKGYGTSAIPVRFGSRAEITLFNYYI